MEGGIWMYRHGNKNISNRGNSKDKSTQEGTAIEDTYIEQNNLPILNPALSFWAAITVVPQTIGKMEKELKMFQIHMYNYF